jgi:hypothetical protein
MKKPLVIAKNRSCSRGKIIYKGKTFLEAKADFRGVPESFLVGTDFEEPLNNFRDAVLVINKAMLSKSALEYKEKNPEEYKALHQWFHEVWELDNEAAKML